MSLPKNKRLSHTMLNYIISLLDKPSLLKILKNKHLTSRQAISIDIRSCFSFLIILMGHPIFRPVSTDVISSLVNTSNLWFFFQRLNSLSSNENLELAMKLLEPVPIALSWQMTKGLCYSLLRLFTLTKKLLESYQKYCFDTSQDSKVWVACLFIQIFCATTATSCCISDCCISDQLLLFKHIKSHEVTVAT